MNVGSDKDDQVTQKYKDVVVVSEDYNSSEMPELKSEDGRKHKLKA